MPTPTQAPTKLNHRALYALVKKIPRGKVATYGQLARLLGLPRHARHVGFALAATPPLVKIPWHRVINAQGMVSARARDWRSGGDDLQRIRLLDEGIVFGASGAIDLKRFQWDAVK